jgi:anti-anti-sigma factor
VNELCSIDVTGAGGTTIAGLRGEIDLSNVPDVEDQLTEIGRAAEVLVVDLTNLEYIDSAGFGMLERLGRNLELRVVVPDGAVIRRAFVVTGMAAIVPVFEAVDDALRPR